jgi:acyl-CoA reductase-like NAD-dependent aldehyde dehydrogenase
MELGGKNAMVVFPDADLDAAVDAAVAGLSLTVSAGQSCQSTSRLLVHVSAYPEFVERTARALDALQIGVAYASGTDMGPLVTRAHQKRVAGFCERAVLAGARNLCATGPISAPAGGFYQRPVLFDSVTPDMEIARDEVFGPVLVAMPWSSYDEVIELVNSSSMGLSAALWSQNLSVAMRAAADIEAGYIWVNDANRHYLGAPFGGFKDSGIGREESLEELNSYWQQKSVNIRLA